MNGEPTQVLTSTDDFSTRTKVVLFLTGNIIPSLLLMASARTQELRVSWQSGQIHDYASLLLSETSGWVFYPFFIYAVASFTLGMMRPRQVCRSRIVLFGIMTGVLLSLQTCFLLSVVWMEIERWNSWRGFLLIGIVLPVWGITAIVVPWIAWSIGKWVYSKLGKLSQKRWWVILLMFSGPILGISLGVGLGKDAFTWLVVLLLFPSGCVLAGGPVWIVAAYSSLLLRLFRLQETRLRYRLSDLFGVFVWLGAYLAAWRFAVEQAVTIYASLPTSPPTNCYVATAAARGHTRFVRSFAAKCTTGETFLVNAQLQYLKCGELAFKTLCPRLHRMIRRIYDRWGPACASWLSHPLAADAAYTTLKPAEWLVRISLLVVAPQASKIARGIYQDRNEEKLRGAR